MWTPPNKRTLPVAIIALALLGAIAGSAWAQAPRAERPSYSVGDKRIRSDGAYDLIRIENDRYVSASDGGREVPPTPDLRCPKASRGATPRPTPKPPPALPLPPQPPPRPAT